MLQTQVNYWTLLENERSHRASESLQHEMNLENARHNLKTEALTDWANREQNRHNAAMEYQAAHELSEQERHSRETERQTWQTIEETHRSNRKREQQTQTSLRQENKVIAESRRHSKAVEAETKRHNKATEYYQGQELWLGTKQLGEAMRHNAQTEFATKYNAVTSRAIGQYEAQTDRLKVTQDWDKFLKTYPFQNFDKAGNTANGFARTAVDLAKTIAYILKDDD